MDDLSAASAAVVVPLLIGVAEAFKRIGMPANWSPILACVLGLMIALGEQAQAGTANWLFGVMKGLALGLSSVGLYSGVKAGLNGVKNGKPPAV